MNGFSASPAASAFPEESSTNLTLLCLAYLANSAGKSSTDSDGALPPNTTMSAVRASAI